MLGETAAKIVVICRRRIEVWVSAPTIVTLVSCNGTAKTSSCVDERSF